MKCVMHYFIIEFLSLRAWFARRGEGCRRTGGAPSQFESLSITTYTRTCTPEEGEEDFEARDAVCHCIGSNCRSQRGGASHSLDASNLDVAVCRSGDRHRPSNACRKSARDEVHKDIVVQCMGHQAFATAGLGTWGKVEGCRLW
jgi:hypothetical protein